MSNESIEGMSALRSTLQLRPGKVVFIPHENYFEVVEIEEMFRMDGHVGDVHITRGFYTRGDYNASDQQSPLSFRRDRISDYIMGIKRFVLESQQFEQVAYVISRIGQG